MAKKKAGKTKKVTSGSSPKAPKGYVVARGSGAARTQYFRVDNSGWTPRASIGTDWDSQQK